MRKIFSAESRFYLPVICYGKPKWHIIEFMIILDSNGKPILRTVVFDVETTGLSPELGDRVIEVGAVALSQYKIVDEFHSLIFVDQPIDPEAGRVHGITEKMLRGRPRAEKVMPRFRDFIGGSIMVAHNVDFDLRFIGSEFARMKLGGLRNAFYCSLEIGRKLLPELPRHDLETLYRELYGRSPARLHRALDDARIAAAIWVKLSSLKEELPSSCR